MSGIDGEELDRIGTFVANQRRLLDLELCSEQEEEQTAAHSNTNSSKKKNEDGPSTGIRSHSRTIHRLEASDVSVGLYGRTVATLTPIQSSSSIDMNSSGQEPSQSQSQSQSQTTSKKVTTLKLLPSHRLTVGDEVEIVSSGKVSQKKGHSSGAAGVISALTETSISIALFGSNNNNRHNHTNNNKNGKEGGGGGGKKNGKPKNEDEEEAQLPSPPLSVVPRSSVEVHRKMLQALDELGKHGVDHRIAGTVIQAAFSTPRGSSATTSSTSTTSKQVIYPKMEPFNSNLDHTQLEAIQFALHSPSPIALIHGPPGTGKTTTIAELIQQAVHVHKLKVLVTAPSNVAVDNLLERLVVASPPPSSSSTTGTSRRKRRTGAHTTNSSSSKSGSKLKLVRIGHPARIKASIMPYSLEALVQGADGTEIVADCRSELKECLRILSNPKSHRNDKRVVYREMKGLRSEIRKREQKVVQDLIQGANVVLATNVGAGGSILGKASTDGLFDLVVIDEAAQALEASCWIPILRGGKRVVLAGDHCQLPPTIKSNSPPVIKGLGLTLFERIMGQEAATTDRTNNTQSMSRMLGVQYRMHENIANWASKAMYSGNLESHESVKHRTLAQLPNVQSIVEKIVAPSSSESMAASTEPAVLAGSTLLLIDTAGCEMYESTNAAGSRYNEGEAQIVASHVKSLLQIGLKAEEIAVITPYNGQVELLRETLLPDIPNLEIRSVDGFQGGEREAVVLSLVRSSDRGGDSGIGFLAEKRRLNVAITRAKRHCAVICDCETVSQNAFLKNLVKWMEENGDYRSAIEFVSSSDHTMDDFNAFNGANMTEIMECLNELEPDTPNDVLNAVLPTLAHASKGDIASEVEPLNTKESQSEARVETVHSPTPADTRTHASVKKGEKDKEDIELKRKRIMDQVGTFAETGKKGEELVLSTELSKFDRLIVHELAEQLDLGHRSEGIEGTDRRITLFIKNEVPKAPLVSSQEKDDGLSSKPSAFMAA
eukprot:scaffold110308_cov53-Attheya_sp.AAC.1